MTDDPESTNPSPRGPARPLWVVLFVAALFVGGVEAASGSAGARGGAARIVSETIPEAEPSSGNQLVYGLTPVDLGLLADALRTREGPYLVAGRPNSDEAPAGPLLTRTPEPARLLRESSGSRTAVRELAAPWRQVTHSTLEGTGRTPKLAAADVYLKVDGSRRPCPRLGLHRFRCGRPGWTELEWRRLEIGGSKRRCIWAHPLENKTTVVDFGPVDPANGDGYLVQTALADHSAGGGPSVFVTVRRGDTTIEREHTPEKGWRRIELPQLDQRAPLTVEISAKKIGQRHFCFRVRQG